MRLLILSCSQRKRPDAGLLPAYERYDGPAWRLVRRFLADHPHAPVRILALSARYGLIAAETAIADYHERLTALRLADAAWLRDYVHTPSCSFLVPPPTAICVCGGAIYRRALAGVDWPPTTPVQWTQGGIGTQLSQLKAWLDHLH